MGKVIPEKPAGKDELVPEQELTPGKHYEWTPGDAFQLTGEEYSQVINGLRAASAVIEALFQEGIKSGVIKEKVLPPQPLKSDKVEEAVPLP